MVRALLVVALLLSLSGLGPGCACDPPPDAPPPPDPVGSVRVDVAGSFATIVLVGLEAPLRAVEVDVTTSGGAASAIVGLAEHDIVEAGLTASPDNEDGGPKSRFTVVVGDTRRLPINDGPLARLTIDEGARVTLGAAAAVDANGKKRALTVIAE